MEEYFAPPPPLSQSAPELSITLPEGPIMRHAVSSTELLYERAMARFYKAVEYEEADNARKRSMSVETDSRRRSFSVDQEGKRLSIQTDPQEAAMTRLRINSLTETEKMSALKRRLSGESANLQINIPRRLSFKEDDNTHINTIRNEINTPEMLNRSLSPLAPPIAEGEGYSDDYTDSTASSDDEKVITPRRSRQRTNEMETYHPRMLSPYRQPENSEAAAVLTKPLPPLPDPNFVPKPILKRPASADGRKPVPSKPERKTVGQLFDRRSASPSPNRSPMTQRKSVEIDEKPKIIQPVERDHSAQLPQVVKDVPQIKVDEPRAPEPEYEPEIVVEPEFIKRPNEIVKKQLIERRQSSLEENKVMANFYGDIIKDHSVRPLKPKVPIYMDPEALKKLEMEDDEFQNDSGITSSTDLSPQSTLSRPFSPPIVQNPRVPSPTLINRRASDLITTPPVVEKESVFARRFSEAAKAKLSNEKVTILPIKDNARLDQITASIDRLEMNKSPTPQRTLVSNGSTLKRHEAQVSSTSSIDDVQSRGRVIKAKTGAVPKRRNRSQSSTRDSSVTRGSVLPVPKTGMEPTILLRRDKSSSRTRNRSESKSPSAMNRKIIINRVAPPKVVPKQVTPSPSRTATPTELQEEVQLKVKSSLTYATDVSILVFATYVYFFKSAILALPIVMLLLYRQISNKVPDWMKRKKS